MTGAGVTTRRAFRRTDDHTPGAARVKLVTENLILPLHPTSVLIKIHAVSLNYRDANIANGGNPWPVIPHGILCNDAAGEVIEIGDSVRHFSVGDRVAPIIDTENITGQEPTRSWLAADEDGVLADHIIFDESKITKLPAYLNWFQASTIPCAGVTAWSALKGLQIGNTVLIQGTGGVSMFALKLARHAGYRVILTSSSDEKLKRIQSQFGQPEIMVVNYSRNPDWHEEVLKLTAGIGVDLVVEVGGSSTLVKSIKCTRRGGTVSQVGYLSKQDPGDLQDLLSVLIDRRVNLRGINAGSRNDQNELCAALVATRITLDDIVDSVVEFEDSEAAIERLWQGKVVGKLVIKVAE